MGSLGLVKADKAASTRIQGHVLNVEGPPRLLVPASVGSVGNCMGRKCDRKCSRFTDDQLAQNGVAIRQNMDILKDGKELVQNGDTIRRDIYGIYKIFDRLTQITAVNDCNTFDDKCIYEFRDCLAQDGVAKGRKSMDLCGFAADKVIAKDKCEYGGKDMNLWDINMMEPQSVAVGVPGNITMAPPGFSDQKIGSHWNDMKNKLSGGDNINVGEHYERVPLAALRRGHIDITEDQYEPIIPDNAGALDDGGDREQFVVQQDRPESPGDVIEAQNRQMVSESARVAQQLKTAIEGANNMLLHMDEPGARIADELIVDMELHLTNSVRFLAEQVKYQDSVVEQLVHTRTTLQEEIEAMAEERSQLVIQLAREREAKPGLSGVELRQLELWGIKDVHELFNQFRLLQVQTKSVGAGSSLSKSSSKVSLVGNNYQQQCQAVLGLQQTQGEPRLLSMGDKALKSEVKARDKVAPSLRAAKIPEPKEFKGKTRVELERFFRYFDPYAASLSMRDSDKALLVGYYLPTLIHQHDSLMQRKACYEDVKRELLNALGSDSSVTTYSIRTALDKVEKPADKSYRALLEEIERKVAEAYGADQGQREQELKKILLRLTQEDPDVSYNSTILPHTSSDYYRLKELVLGTEDANKLRKQNVVSKKSLDRDSSFSRKFNGREQRYGTPPKAWSPKKYPGNTYHSSDTVPTRYNDQGSIPPRSAYVPPATANQDNRSYLKCYECQGTDHLAKNCPRRREAHVVDRNKHYHKEDDELSELEYTPDEEEPSSFPVGGIVPVNAVRNSSNSVKMFGEKTLLEVHFDGIKVSSMLDSGACVSVINHETLKKILRNKSRYGKITREQEHLYKGNGLVGANGSRLNVVDCVRIPIAWGEYPPSPAIFFVVAGLQQEVLIGTNVLNGNPTWLNALEYALKAKREPASLPKHSFASGDYKSAKTKKCLESINGVGCKGTKVLETSFKATCGDAGTEACTKKFAGEKLNEIYTLLYRALFCIREIDKNDHQYGQQTMLSTQTRDASIGTVLTRDENKIRNFEHQNRDASSSGANSNKNHQENWKFFKRANFVQSSQSSKRSSPVHQNCNRNTKKIRGLQLFRGYQSSRDPQSTRDAQSTHDPQSSRRQKNARSRRKNQIYWGQ